MAFWLRCGTLASGGGLLGTPALPHFVEAPQSEALLGSRHTTCLRIHSPHVVFSWVQPGSEAY